ncbi:hypothetical protein ACVMIH_001764 [Bradyrhizobium sp. USDA 4503]
MAYRGYIKLYRSLYEHEFFRPSPMSEREVFTWMIQEAAWKPRQRRFGQFFVDLDRGDLAGSLRFLAEKWLWSVGAVRGYLGRCEKEGMINTRTDKGVTIITICNYEYYQGDDQPDDTVDDKVSAQRQQGDSTAPAHDQHKTEEIKNTRKEEGDEHIAPVAGRELARAQSLFGDDPPAEERQPKRRGRQTAGRRTKLPADWELPVSGWKYARDRGWNDDHIRFQAEKFKNFHTSRGNLMADWDAAWRTWVGNDYDRRTPRGGTPAAPSRVDTAIEGMMAGLTEEDFHARSR